MTHVELLAEMKRIRTQTNDVWMELVQIALEADPERTKACFRKVQTNDALVADIFRKLSE